MAPRTPEETALLIALLFKRSGQRRGRIGHNVLLELSGRNHVTSSFVVQVKDVLAYDSGIVMAELNGRGYGLIPAKSLDGAPPIALELHMSISTLPIKKVVGHGPPVINIRSKGKKNNQTQSDRLDFDSIREELASHEAQEE